MTKQEALARWSRLEAGQDILPHFTPIAADARGSTFGACGIRVSGNPAFVDAVLSRLKDLLQAESGATRLTLSRQPVKTVSIANGGEVVEKHWKNADSDAETCYIQIRERTSSTRLRKAQAHTDPIPGMGMEGVKSAEKRPTKPSENEGGTESAAGASAPHKGDEDSGFKVAHIGTLPTGEVILDDEDEECFLL